MGGVGSPENVIVAALVELVVEDGIEGVTIRRVADRAGVSIGAVQHHFPTKSALLAAAMDHVSAQFQAAVVADLADVTSPRTALKRLAARLAGLSESDGGGSVVWLTFVAKAAVDPDLRAKHVREWAQVEQTLASLLQQVLSLSHPGEAADRAAALLALLDGLSISVALEPQRIPSARAARLVDDAVHWATRRS